MFDELSRSLNSKPTYLFFTITSRCNAFCDFCWNWRNVLDAGKFWKEGKEVLRPELTLEEIDKLTLNLSKMLVVNLFGGEPFLRRDIYEIMALFSKNCQTKYISIPTNGFLTDHILNSVTKAVKDFPDTFFKIYLSIDGPAEVHNKVRKLKDGYQKAMTTAKGLVDLRETHKNLSLSINVNYNSETQDHSEEFLKHLMEIQYFDSISIDLVRGDDLYDKGMLVVDEQRFYRLQKLVEAYKLKSSQPFSPLHKAIEQRTQQVIRNAIKSPEKRVFNCFAGKKILLLNDIGEIYSCEHLLDRSMGNIRNFDYSIEKLLQSETAKRLRKDITDEKCNCRWECAINTSNIFDLRNYPDLIARTGMNMLKS